MRTGKNNSFCGMLIKSTLIFISLVLIFNLSSCRKETNTEKLSSKSSLVFSVDQKIVGHFFCDGEPGLFTTVNKSIQFDSVNSFVSQAYINKIGLNTTNGKFVQSILGFNPSLPKYTTIYSTINQLKPNGTSFILNSVFTLYDTGSNPHPYTKLYITDKTISALKPFELPDSSIVVNGVKQMEDGRYAVMSTKGTIKSLSCFNGNLKSQWTRIVEFGNNSENYDNFELLVSPNYIYLLQIANYITKNYRVLQYDYDGRKISTYELTSITNKYAAGQIIESPNGFYIIGTRYLPEKSDYDLSISTMSPNNKLLEEHGLNITDYFPDWNTASLNLLNTYFSNGCSYTIKTTSGYAFTFTYPDNKNNRSLALVLLDDQMKVKSVKVIAKIKGVDINQINNQYITILTDGNRLYILWNQYFNNYFYVLDEEGNLINE